MQQNFQFNSQLDNQIAASDPERSVWVFASAGSGKTKILVDRLLRLLLLGIEPAKILCLTYTKIAATEMQNRINKELADWVILKEEELIKRLKNLTGIVPNLEIIARARGLLIKILDAERSIKIQTIHSFCQALLASFPFEAEIAINFDLLTDVQVAVILKNVQKKLLVEAWNSKKKSETNHEFSGNFGTKTMEFFGRFSQKKIFQQPELYQIIEEISASINDEGLIELLSKLLAKKEKLFFLREKFQKIDFLIEELAKILAVDIELDETQIFTNFWQQIDQKTLRDLCDALNSNRDSRNRESGQKLEKFLADPNSKNFNFLSEALQTQKGEPKELFKKLDLNHRESYSKICKLLDDYKQEASAFSILWHNALLLRFVYIILDEYQKYKHQKGYLDYGDLIILSSKLLSNPKHKDFIRMKMDGKFDHILIDESQDTNSEQWQIIKALTDDFAEDFFIEKNVKKPRSIFVVGDEKQSIFSFQGADVKMAGQVLNHFKNQIGSNFSEISLNLSFRSKSLILEALDRVFAEEARKNAICKIGDYQKHHSFRGVGGHVEIWKIINSKEKTSKKSEAKEEKNFAWQLDNFGFNAELKEDEIRDQEILAKLIAKKIKSWIAERKKIDERIISFGDIMILLNTKTNGLAQSLASEFSCQKIPFSTVEKLKFSECLTIQDFLAAARFACLPEDDFNLACLLKSPFFNVSEEELLEFCLQKNRQNISLHEVLRTSKHWQYLEFIRLSAKEKNAFKFFYDLIFDEKNYQNFLIRLGAGVENIIENFFFLLDEFCAKNNSELQLFIEFVEEGDLEISVISGEKNAVRISTIHSAKGLQSPIVIMPDCLHNLAQFRSNTENLLWLENLPLYLPAGASENFLIKDLKNHRFQSNFEEYLRLLYVAMTRAEDELYIGGFGNQKDENCWYKIIEKSLADFALLVDLEEQMAEFENNLDEPNESELIGISKELKNKKSVKDQDCELSASIILANEDHEKLLSKKTNNDSKNLKNSAGNFNKISKSQDANGFEINSAAANFGKILHELLEIIGRNHHQDLNFLQEILKNLIANQRVSKQQQEEIWLVVSNFLNSAIYQEIFKKNEAAEFFCEIELIANNEAGRLDLLRKNANEILVIDYKSDENLPNELPENYKNQLLRYVALAQKIFPDSEIKAAILWIRHCKLEFLRNCK